MDTGLSLEAQKAVEEGRARARTYRPTVWITKSLRQVIVTRPSGYNEGSLTLRGFACWMTQHLPNLKFDGRRDWWTAPISELDATIKVMDSRASGFNLSAGAKQYLDGKAVAQ